MEKITTQTGRDIWVVKRNGEQQKFDMNKILHKINNLSQKFKKLDFYTEDLENICNKLHKGIVDQITTEQLNELFADICQDMSIHNPDLGILAGRILVYNNQRKKKNFVEINKMLFEHGIIEEKYFRIVQNNKDEFLKKIDYEKDYNTDYFSFKTLYKQYLIKVEDKVVESKQDMLMRVALQLHEYNLEEVLRTYDDMSNNYYLHSSPTLFNSLIKGRNQLSSCFLVNMKDDSIEGIYDTLQQVAVTSKYGAGISLSVSNIRAEHSAIGHRKKASSSIVKMLKNFNSTIQYVNQQNIRNGSLAIYLEMHHPDILNFLQMRVNNGNIEDKCLYLFSAVWVSDLFMKRVEQDKDWSLFCPKDVGYRLENLWGEEYEKLYLQLEKEKRYRAQINARTLWYSLMRSIIESNIYVLFKDTVNRQSNQKNFGTIKQSNLCIEIVQYTDPDNTAVCSLASLILPSFLQLNHKFQLYFDFNLLYQKTQQVTKNINKVIDTTFYPTEEAKRASFAQRAIGIGQMGLQDVFFQLGYPFESKEALELSTRISECIYHAALSQSVELAKQFGPYSKFQGSDFSKGILQFDYRGHKPAYYDFESLKEKIIKFGTRNSLLTSIQPTASIAQVSSCLECVEPIQSNLFQRSTLSGSFVIINKYLIKYLRNLGLWNSDILGELIASEGSVQNIEHIPPKIKELFKTSFEIKQKSLINMFAARQNFIDQSQSMNLFFEKPTINALHSALFYGFKEGMKSGLYYLRQKPSVESIKLQFEKRLMTKSAKEADLEIESEADDTDICTHCQ